MTQMEQSSEQGPVVASLKADPSSPAYISLTEDGGCKKKILTPGSGPVVAKDAKVSVHYDGYLLSGEKFDSSRDRGDLFSFTLGQSSVIKAWEVGIASMKIGEVCELLCAPDYAYGASGSPPKIPPQATLKFVVEMFTASDFDEPLDARMTGATESKTRGNSLFKDGQYSEALTEYRSGATRFSSAWSSVKEEQIEVRNLQTSLSLNIAAALLKLKDCKEALSECEKILAWEPTNVKANFRFAQALAGLSDYQGAIKKLTETLALDPENSSVTDEIKKVKAQESRVKQQQKELYSRMFQ